LPEQSIKAAIFDIGGVLTTSPVYAIRDYALASNIDYSILGPMLALEDGAWSRYEKSEISEEEFCSQFEEEGRALGIECSGQAVQEAAFGTQAVRPEMIAVVRALKGRLRLGCITNNVVRNDSRPSALGDLHELFEVVIESRAVGLRKPDPRIYQLACDQLGVKLQESVFLDDIGVNLKGARAIGMKTIKVDQTLSAVDELERLLGFELPRSAQ